MAHFKKTAGWVFTQKFNQIRREIPITVNSLEELEAILIVRHQSQILVEFIKRQLQKAA